MIARHDRDPAGESIDALRQALDMAEQFCAHRANQFRQLRRGILDDSTQAAQMVDPLRGYMSDRSDGIGAR